MLNSNFMLDIVNPEFYPEDHAGHLHDPDHAHGEEDDAEMEDEEEQEDEEDETDEQY